MDELIKKLQAERQRLWDAQKAALDAASAAGRTHLDGQDEQAYNERNARIDEIDGRVKELLDSQRRSEEAQRAFDELAATPKVPGAGAERQERSEAAQVRAWLLGEDNSREFPIRPREGERSFRESAAETRELGTVSATAGGNTVPTSFYRRLVEHMIEHSGLLALSPFVLNTTSGEALDIPKTTAFSTAGIVAEAATIPESDPAFGKVTLNAYKYGFRLGVPHELVTDTAVDLLGFLARQAGRALGDGFGAHGITGTGTNQPNGVLTASTAGKTGATAGGAPIADDLIDLHYSVIAPYRRSASCGWLMDDSTVAVVRKFKDSNGQYLWQPALTAGSPDLILGKPVHTDPNMPAVASSAKSILFGDFLTYWVRMVEGIRFERSDDFAFDRDVITYRALIRADSDQVDTTGAIKHYVGAV